MNLYQFFDPNSPEYVILHAQSRARRGKCPTVSFRGINNPREALKKAYAVLYQDNELAVISPQLRALTSPVMLRIVEALGLRFMSIDDFEQLINCLKPDNNNPSVSIPLNESDEEVLELDPLNQKQGTLEVPAQIVFIVNLD